jgi:hypothetical protein
MARVPGRGLAGAHPRELGEGRGGAGSCARSRHGGCWRLGGRAGLVLEFAATAAIVGRRPRRSRSSAACLRSAGPRRWHPVGWCRAAPVLAWRRAAACSRLRDGAAGGLLGAAARLPVAAVAGLVGHGGGPSAARGSPRPRGAGLGGGQGGARPHRGALGRGGGRGRTRRCPGRGVSGGALAGCGGRGGCRGVL